MANLTDQERLARMYQRLSASLDASRAVFTDLLLALERIDPRGVNEEAHKDINNQRTILIVALNRWDKTVGEYFRNLNENGD